MRIGRFCGLGLLLFPMFAGQAAPSWQAAVTLRSKTRLVQLAVVVRDKKGLPVTDLRAGDFTVEDEGKRQEIRFFSLESEAVAAKDAALLPPGVYSNRRIAHPGSTGGITAILLDGINTRWGDQAIARRNVVEYLSQIQPRDRVALYTLGRELKILHDFTEEPAELVKALAAYRGEQTPHLQATSWKMRAFASFTDLVKEEANYYMHDRVSMALTALEAIARYLAGVSGRKNLLWVSGGFPLTWGYGNDDRWEALGGDPRYSARTPARLAYDPLARRNANAKVTLTFEKECQNAIRALNAADVAVYPVDARGLTTNPLARNNIATMKDIAGGTGGRAYFSRNDLMNSIREAVQDSVVSYNLAYYPSERKPDGRFRKIRVKVKRPGLTVRHRPGYYDADISPFDENTKETAIRVAVWSPLDATAVALEAQLDTKGGANPEALALHIKIDAGNLALEERDSRWTGQFDLALVQTDAQGSEREVRVQSVPLDLAQDASETIMKQGLILNKTVQRDKNAVALRVVVRDAASGSLGRVMIPLQKR